MLNLLGSSLELSVSRHTITFAHTQGRWKPVTTLLASCPLAKNTFALPELLQPLRDVLSHTPPSSRRISIILANDCARFFVVTPPKNPSHLNDCKAAAAMRFQALYGEPSHSWHVEGQWDVHHPFIACAIPQTLRNTLLEAAREHNLTIISITSQFFSDWNRWCSQLTAGAWLGTVHDNLLTLGVIHHQRLYAVRTLYLPEEAFHRKEWLLEHSRREALKLNVPNPEHIQLTGGTVPDIWIQGSSSSLQCTHLDTRLDSTETRKEETLIVSSVVLRAPAMRSKKEPQPALSINFAPPSQSRLLFNTSPLHIILSFIAFLLCINALFSALYLAQHYQIRASLMDQTYKRLSKKNLPLKRIKESELSISQADAINSAITQLNIPWPKMFDAIEVSTPTKIALLELEPDVKQHRLKGLAEAKSSDDMITYIERLKKHTFFDLVVLTKHEVNDKDPNKPIRFQFEAQWRKDKS